MRVLVPTLWFIAACSSTVPVNGTDGPAPDAAKQPDAATDVGLVDSAILPDAEGDAGHDLLAGDAGDVQCEAKTIQSKEELIAILESLSWAVYLPSLSQNVVSAPCTISNLTIQTKELTVPAGCGSDCYQGVLFSNGFGSATPPAGVSFSDEADVATTAYQTVRLNNVTVRFRAVMENTHPFKYNYVPQIKIEPDCADSCEAPAVMCPKDSLCYSGSLCSICYGGDKKLCACYDGAHPAEEGTACSYISNTMSSICEGTCQAGQCVYAGDPDVYCP